jgi:hypothetical protein
VLSALSQSAGSEVLRPFVAGKTVRLSLRQRFDKVRFERAAGERTRSSELTAAVGSAQKLRRDSGFEFLRQGRFASQFRLLTVLSQC